MNYRIVLFVTFLTSPLLCVNGYNILGIFIHPGESHFRFFQPVLNALVENGHMVTTVSYFPAQTKHANYSDIVLAGEALTNSVDMAILDDAIKYFGLRNVIFYYLEMFDLFKWGRRSCDNFMTSGSIDQVLKLHRAKPFDLVLTEIFNTDCHLSVIHKLNIPYVTMGSSVLMPWQYDRFGYPDTPSHIPSHLLPYSENMSFTSRIVNWIVARTMKSSYRVMEYLDDRAIKQRFGEGVPSVRELATKSSLHLVNQHYSFTGARPLSPKIVEVGGLHVKDNIKPLPKHFADIMNNAKHGVVLISWGSLIRAATLPVHVRQAIVRAVAKFPQSFIWKWEEDQLEEQPKNLYTSKWLPQQDILCHPNVKAFISHGGLMGTTEALHCGIPMVVTPIFGDQPNNAAALVNRNMAVLLDYEDITEETMTEAIRKVLQSDIYQNAKTISYSYNNRLVKPMDTALWWIDHAIKTNGHPLGKSHSIEMCWFSYYSFDVMLVLSIVTAVFILISLKFLRFCLRLCSKKPDKPTKQKKN